MEPSFEATYRQEFRAVWRLVARLLPAGAPVEDLVHDVFLTAYRRWSTYDPARPVRPWLQGIAVRLVSDHRALKRHTHERSGLPAEDEHEPVTEPPTVLERRDAHRILEQALGEMRDEEREVFVLHELEEHPVPFIAAAMGTPVPTAYSRLRSAKLTFGRVVARQEEVRS